MRKNRMDVAYQRAHERRGAEDRIATEREDAGAVRRMAWVEQNRVERKWIESLIERSGHEGAKAKLARILKWLVSRPTSTLFPSMLREVERIDTAIRMVEHGKPCDPTKRKARPRTRLWPARVQPARPDWMDDPSLLPKRPPGQS